MTLRTYPLALALLTACGPQKTDDGGESTTDAGTTADAPTTDAPGPTTGAPEDTTTAPTTGDSTTGDPTTGEPVSPDDFNAQAACEPQICDEFLHGDGEAMGHPDGSEGYLEVERCILEGLRDGTPGRYVAGVASVFGNGDNLERLQIVVHGDRQVTWAGYYKGGFYDPGDESSYEYYSEAVTCTLVDVSFFDDCLVNHDDYTHYPQCMQTDGWWTGCVAAGPRCE